MGIRKLFDKIKASEFREIEDPQQFISERRGIVQDAIRELSHSGYSTGVALEKLQNEVEQLRMLKHSPEERLKELIPLIEERVSQLEAVLQKINQCL